MAFWGGASAVIKSGVDKCDPDKTLLTSTIAGLYTFEEEYEVDEKRDKRYEFPSVADWPTYQLFETFCLERGNVPPRPFLPCSDKAGNPN